MDSQRILDELRRMESRLGDLIDGCCRGLESRIEEPFFTTEYATDEGPVFDEEYIFDIEPVPDCLAALVYEEEVDTTAAEKMEEDREPDVLTTACIDFVFDDEPVFDEEPFHDVFDDLTTTSRIGGFHPNTNMVDLDATCSPAALFPPSSTSTIIDESVLFPGRAAAPLSALNIEHGDTNVVAPANCSTKFPSGAIDVTAPSAVYTIAEERVHRSYARMTVEELDKGPLFDSEPVAVRHPKLATNDDDREKEEERTPPKPANCSTKCPSGAIEDPEPEPMLIWGVLLVGDDERMDTVLLKFLHAGEFKVKEAMAILKSAVLQRKRVGIDALLAADLGLLELDQVVFYRGEFQDKDFYEKVSCDEEKHKGFLKRCFHDRDIAERIGLGFPTRFKELNSEPVISDGLTETMDSWSSKMIFAEVISDMALCPFEGVNIRVETGHIGRQASASVMVTDAIHSPDCLAVTTAGIAVALSEIPNKQTIAGALLGIGIVTCGVKNDCDPALAILMEYISKDDSNIHIGAVLGLGMAYAGTQKDELKMHLSVVLGDSQSPLEVLPSPPIHLDILRDSTKTRPIPWPSFCYCQFVWVIAERFLFKCIWSSTPPWPPPSHKSFSYGAAEEMKFQTHILALSLSSVVVVLVVGSKDSMGLSLENKSLGASSKGNTVCLLGFLGLLAPEDSVQFWHEETLQYLKQRNCGGVGKLSWLKWISFVLRYSSNNVVSGVDFQIYATNIISFSSDAMTVGNLLSKQPRPPPLLPNNTHDGVVM